MKIKLSEVIAGPDGVFQPGEIIEVPDHIGSAIIGAGAAICADPPKPCIVLQAPEAATAPPPETAMRPKAKGRGR